jgi:aryl-alcohol dehydrogenase-like predicted oxidoreductase
VDQQDRPAAASGTFAIGGDLEVHRLGYGAMRITGEGVWGEPEDPAQALAVLRRAVELGVNLIDTADSYGPEVSERLIAEAIDLFQLHRIDPKVPAEDQLGLLADLEAEGKVRHVGLSEVSVEELDAAPAQLALAWLLRRSPVMLPIPGTSKVAHLEENCAAALVELDDEELSRLAA